MGDVTTGNCVRPCAHRCPECGSVNDAAHHSTRLGGTTCQVCGNLDTLTLEDFLQDSARLALHVGESQAALEQQQTRQTPSDQHMQKQGDSKLQSPRQVCTPQLEARGKRTLVSASKPATVVAVTSAAPSVWVAYVLFLCFGLFGLHHLYLKRPHQVLNHTRPSPCPRSVLVVIIEFDQ